MRFSKLLLFGLCLLLDQCERFAHGYCNVYCDGHSPDLATGLPRQAASETIENSLQLVLIFADNENMGFAKISNSNGKDDVWLDRSFDGGLTWADGSVLGFTTVPEGSSEARTMMYNVDNWETRGIGALRACGKHFNTGTIRCTEFARSTVNAETPIDAAATALMQYYDGQLWHVIGWWNEANVLNALIEYMLLTGSRTYYHVVDEVFRNNIGEWDGNFTSDALDDTEWWAMVWISAYDLTGESKYLQMAKLEADYINQYIDSVCGGGVWWNIYKTYKNAITNELLILLNAALYNRLGIQEYEDKATELWSWFKSSGMINEDHLINDGLRGDCSNNQDTTWTYNQGVILGALTELYYATEDTTYLDEAVKIADAVIESPKLTKDGILTEPCEFSGPVECGEYSGGCDCNAVTFKGVFMRHLGELNRNLPGHPYQTYIELQRDTNYSKNRNLLNQYGVHFNGPLEDTNPATSQSAFESFTSALKSQVQRNDRRIRKS